MNKGIVIAAMIIAAGIPVFGGGVYYERERINRESIQNAPHCPTEDSCFADYRNGKWYIIEGSR